MTGACCQVSLVLDFSDGFDFETATFVKDLAVEFIELGSEHGFGKID